METLTLMRTICCEAYRECGRRCAICPNRPENRAAVLRMKQQTPRGFGRGSHDPKVVQSSELPIVACGSVE
jgi:hypothetical protein